MANQRHDDSKPMKPVTRERPCPACGHPDWCLIADDGNACICQRVEQGSRKRCGDAGWLHVLVESSQPHQGSSSKAQNTPGSWEFQAKRFAENLTPEKRAKLATLLGLPSDGLDSLPLVGMNPGDKGFTSWPEFDALGNVIGINRRFKSGDKKAMPKSKRGLTLPTGWQDRPGPLLIVEGATDAAALTAAGLCAVGTYAAGQGSKLLAELLAKWPKDREIVIVGENDQKDDGHWPGKDGAIRLANDLTKLLGRPVKWSMTPDGVKDSRDWLTRPEHGQTTWPERGAEFVTKLLASTEAPEPSAPNSGKRPVIVTGCDEHRVNAEATSALAREPDVYQRGGLLVTVQVQEVDTEATATIRRDAGTPVVRELPKPLLRERLTAVAGWVKETDEGERIPIHPPGWSVDAVLARGKWPEVRTLEAVLTHPVILPDGTILATNGYHRESRLFLAMPPDLQIKVPDSPTKAEIAESLEVLFDPLADFPFETNAHKAALIAGLFTSLAWFAFTGPAPWFLIDKNVRGAGAGLLADVVAFILTGHRFPVMSYTNDIEEMRKKVTSVALSGERLLLLDNLTGAVGNEIMDRLLTAELWDDRLLGGNRYFRGYLHAVWWGTANNVQLSADTSRRVCHVRMESSEERPEMRDDVKYKDLRAHVRANRSQLLSAALTILRGWWKAGKPKYGLKPWGSYESWSDVVRECVVFAGLADPGETRLVLQEAADRDAAAMRTILACFERRDTGGRGQTVAEFIDVLKDDSQTGWKAEAREAIEELCGKLDARLLGYKFRHFKRRNFGGKMLDIAGTDSSHGNRWKVFPANSERMEATLPQTSIRGDEGDKGDVPAPEKSENHSQDGSGLGDEGDDGDVSGPKKSRREYRPDPVRGLKGGNQ
ncbi:MAG: hypothetical protein ACRC8S_04580 [Fimbriiglobus sp.]